MKIHNYFNDLREMRSENGVQSSKRWLADRAMTVVLIVFAYLAYKEGGSDAVKDIAQTLVISVCAMLGVAAFTKFGHSGQQSNNTKDKEDSNETE